MNLSHFLTVVLLVPSFPAGTSDWPQCRGRGRVGVVAGARLPQAWPAQFPAPRWRAGVGEGYSSPVVVNGRVFLLGKPKTGEETCFCFDAHTGRPLWSVPYASPYEQ